MANWPSGATPSWPQTLPWRPLLDGYNETLPELTIRTQMDVGPAKVRRRTTANVRLVRLRVGPIARTNCGVLETFYETTCQGGAVAFAWYADMKQSAIVFTEAWYRFIKPPAWTALGGGWYVATLELERMP